MPEVSLSKRIYTVASKPERPESASQQCASPELVKSQNHRQSPSAATIIHFQCLGKWLLWPQPQPLLLDHCTSSPNDMHCTKVSSRLVVGSASRNHMVLCVTPPSLAAEFPLLMRLLSLRMSPSHGDQNVPKFLQPQRCPLAPLYSALLRRASLNKRVVTNS